MKWYGSLQQTQLDSVSHTKILTWSSRQGNRENGRGGLMKCAEAQRWSVRGCSSVNILCGMWKLCFTALPKICSSCRGDKSRSGTLLGVWSSVNYCCCCCYSEASLSLTVGKHFLTLCQVAYDPHHVFLITDNFDVYIFKSNSHKSHNVQTWLKKLEPKNIWILFFA